MSNLHRIQWFDAQIRGLRYPNSTQLAAEFCISTRQAARDIEYLKYSLGAPLGYSAEKRGYFYTTTTFTLPTLIIGAEEKAALGFLADQYRAAGQQLTTQLANLFARLSGREQTNQESTNPDNPDLPVYTIHSKLLNFINLIKAASAQQKKIKIQYLDLGHNRTERIVHPYLLFQRKAGTYLQCFCETRQAERSLRVDRIVELTVLEESFQLPSHFNRQLFEAGHFRFNYRLPYIARLRFDVPLPPAALKDFAPVPIHSAENVTAGNYEYTLSFYQSSQLLSGLMLTGIGFTILVPDWLRQRYCEFLAHIIEKNSKS